MQSAKKILADLGFNKDASLETQKAFLKHLVAAANQTRPIPMATPEVKTSTLGQNFEAAQPKEAAHVSNEKGVQLEFDFSDNKQRVS